MKHSRVFRLVVAFFFCFHVASAQVATGRQPFGSFGGGPFDTVNLGNLNVHFSIPVLHKAGRGLPFSYDLSYDSSIWYPVTANGHTSWNPTLNWGWMSQSPAMIGYLKIATSSQTQSMKCSGGFGGITTHTTTYTYFDNNGRSHPFPGSTLSYSYAGGCSGPAYGSPLTTLTTDGSGYTLYAPANQSGTTVTTLSGVIVATNVVGQGNAGQYQDNNGNELTVNASGQYFDTLSSSQAVLTQAGNGTPSSPLTYTYTAPSGANAAYTVNFTQYTVATNFGISGVGEYGSLSNALVSSITLPDSTSYTFTYEKTPGSCTPLANTWQTNCITGRIASVTLPTGGTITYTYSGGSNGIYSDGSTAGLDRILAASTTCNSSNGCWQYSRSLQSGTPGPGSTWQTTVIDPNSNYTVLNLAEDASTNTSTTVATYDFYETQRQAYQGSVSSTACSATVTTNCLLATAIKCYNGNYAGCSTASVNSPISQTDVYSRLTNGNTRLSETILNGFGLMTDDKEYDYGVSLGSAPGTSHLIKEIAITYNTSLGNNIVDRPASVTVSDWSTGTQTTLAYSTYGYDAGTPITTSSPQHISITGSRGNLTSSSLYTGSNYLIRQFTYYDTGMLNNSTSPDLSGGTTCANKPGICTTYNYSSSSCGNSFVTSINEPMSLSRSMTWSCTGGVLTQATDENANSVQTNYTNAYFWRPDNTYDQENNETTINYFGATAVESSLVNFNGGQSVVDTRATVDGYGRLILSQRLQGPGVGANYDTSETDYNNVGLPYQTTMPFAAAASTTSSTAPRTTTTYDALGRPLTIKDANNGTVSYSYTNNDVMQTVSGTQTFQKQVEYDGFGRLASVCEMSQATGSGTCGQSNQVSGFWTKYTYDALGHMLTVKQNAQAATGSQQNRVYAYDEQGRITSESNPETGIIAYTFDRADSTCGSYVSAGDLVEKKDAIGNVTCFQYDSLHRMTQTTYPAGTYASNTPTKCFVYDSATVNSTSMANAKTRLAEAYTTAASSCPSTATVDEGFSYSVRGETADVWEKTPDSGGWYHVNATYWANGSLDVLNGGSSPLPGLPAITYGASDGSGLEGEGRVTKVTASTGQTPLVNSVTYNNSSNTQPIGALTGTVLGSTTSGTGDSDSFSYDTNTGRLLQYQFNMGTGPQSQTGTLQWNTNGTLAQLQITDQINTANSQTCTFAYDDLTRIDSANCGSVWSQTFGFDPFGNLSKTGSAQFLPTYTGASGTGTAPSNQYYQLPGGNSGVSNYYDSNGNLTSDYVSGTGHTYGWDADGNLLKVDSSTVVLIYDALDRMVEQTRGSSHTEVVYAPYGAKLALMNTQSLLNAFAALPGGGSAVYNSSGLAYYRHPDHLGSSRLATTPSRTKYYDVAYAPYGEDYNGSGTADLSFTTQNQDTVGGGWTTNLYDFLMREYRTGHGRWTSPDPAGMAAVEPTAPQSWNRYAYAINNPMSYVDPLGLQQSAPGHCQAGSGDPCGGPGAGGDGYALWGVYGYTEQGDGPWGLIGWVLDWQGWGGASGNAGNGAKMQVSKPYATTVKCNTNAAGVMKQVESNFSQFGNYKGEFGPLGIPGASAAVTFGTGSATPVTPGGSIPISAEVEFPTPMPILGNSVNVSVTVASVSPTSFTFNTDSGHVLYPASITFSATDAGNNQIGFLIQVNGDFSSRGSEIGYYAGGYNLENNIWNHFEQNVGAFCAGKPTSVGVPSGF
jgi:RHS repeat-associated protein